MSTLNEQVMNDLNSIVTEWTSHSFLNKDDLFVIGCSTSEIAGEQIGTSGSEDLAGHIFDALQTLTKKTGIHLVFQCCEHLNRALVVERETMKTYGLEEVTVVPLPEAGGSMASYAYKQMKDAVVVESVQAHAGMDIGDTMIGMHLKNVAVPLRFKQQSIGHAHVTAARTRPKLIGGSRASYPS